MKSRDVIKNLTAIPVSGVISGSPYLFESSEKNLETSSIPANAKRNLFKELGIRTFINGCRHLH